MGVLGSEVSGKDYRLWEKGVAGATNVTAESIVGDDGPEENQCSQEARKSSNVTNYIFLLLQLDSASILSRDESFAVVILAALRVATALLKLARGSGA
ncbi:hypothetical protein EYC79_18730 [Agrobacterium cavarae]|uniref:Uncharacterized protein n=1 Tax=Agrobacterium cavarae TaxID=2528239 RepID=A0ABY1Y361_9HYPH|nr:hypothetical protein [Agrobacterium cavarae]TBN09236.1 hypothetical protein EYC79_18730 [Agrobacterium cavarae]